MSDPSPREIFDRLLPERLQERPGLTAGLGSPVAFEILGEQGGVWLLEPRAGGAAIRPGPGRAARRLAIEAADLAEIWTGRLPPRAAVWAGRIKFRPFDLELALRLEPLFAPAGAEPDFEFVKGRS